MKFLSKDKDGGYESTVWGYWLIEIKSLFSIVLLKFENGSREAYHEHAFNCFSWLLKGKLIENMVRETKTYLPSWKPFITRRQTFHKVVSEGTSWVLSFRGPWKDHWVEYDEKTGERYILTHGRKKV